MIRVGINGYGRTGRALHRSVLAHREQAEVEVVAVNDPFGDAETMAFLLEHDSVSGHLGHEVRADDGGFSILTERGFSVGLPNVTLLGREQPEEIPWGEHEVDIVVDCSGAFTDRDQAAGHLEGEAQKVVISAPSKNADITLCIGVNDGDYDPEEHVVVSNASCTTNCLAPMAKVLDERFGLEEGLMTTVHAYTASQALHDEARQKKKDFRRIRAAAVNIIPTSTGAAEAVGKVLPHLGGRLNGMAMRVPVIDGSITDLTAVLGRPASVEQVNEAFREAAGEPAYRGVLRYSEKQLVSQDIIGDPASCVFSAPDTMVAGRAVKVLGWYDNEWGYSTRLIDICRLLAGQLEEGEPATAAADAAGDRAQ